MSGKIGSLDWEACSACENGTLHDGCMANEIILKFEGSSVYCSEYLAVQS